MSGITDEIKKRRTFAIISHPDAGKTTLTEKLFIIWWCNQSGRFGERKSDCQACGVGLDGD